MREFILHNFWWKLASFIVATLIWLTIHSTLQTGSPVRPSPIGTAFQREFKNLTITVMTRASDRTDFVVAPSVVDVTLGGESAVLKKISAKDIQVFVDLTELQAAQDLPKQILVHLSESVPDSVFVQRVSPQNVRVSRSNSNPVTNP